MDAYTDTYGHTDTQGHIHTQEVGSVQQPRAACWPRPRAWRLQGSKSGTKPTPTPSSSTHLSAQASCVRTRTHMHMHTCVHTPASSTHEHGKQRTPKGIVQRDLLAGCPKTCLIPQGRKPRTAVAHGPGATRPVWPGQPRGAMAQAVGSDLQQVQDGGLSAV